MRWYSSCKSAVLSNSTWSWSLGFQICLCCSSLKRTRGPVGPRSQAWCLACSIACSWANWAKLFGDQAGASGWVVVPAVAKCDGSRGSQMGLVSGYSIKLPQYWFNSCGSGIISWLTSLTSMGSGSARGSG
jgi:hypothetical protein